MKGSTDSRADPSQHHEDLDTRLGVLGFGLHANLRCIKPRAPEPPAKTLRSGLRTEKAKHASYDRFRRIRKKHLSTAASDEADTAIATLARLVQVANRDSACTIILRPTARALTRCRPPTKPSIVKPVRLPKQNIILVVRVAVLATAAGAAGALSKRLFVHLCRGRWCLPEAEAHIQSNCVLPKITSLSLSPAISQLSHGRPTARCQNSRSLNSK